jgi:hypothetical protein
MMQEEARLILTKSEWVQGYPSDHGGRAAHELGPFVKLDDTGWFWFVAYPYSTENPVNYNLAFYLFVDSKTGEIDRSNGPLSPEELEQIRGEK